jgi:hypothetical protein
VKSYPDVDDRVGHRNVGIQRTPNAADSTRRLHQVYSPRKHRDLYQVSSGYICLGQDNPGYVRLGRIMQVTKVLTF